MPNTPKGAAVPNTAAPDTPGTSMSLEIPDAAVDALTAFDPDADEPATAAFDVARPVVAAELRRMADTAEADADELTPALGEHHALTRHAERCRARAEELDPAGGAVDPTAGGAR